MNNKLLSPSIPVFGTKLPAYHACGIIGYLAAALQGTLMVSHLGLSQWVWAGIALTSAGTFLALAMLTKIIIGEERLIYYHHEIAVVATVSAYLWLLGQPLLLWLDITVLGIGMFLVFGRLGCLMVGCCHGRPNRFGITYGHDHVKAGFTPYFCGIRLFPVQAMESASAFIIVGTGVTIVLTGCLPGTAFVWYVAAYGAVRFILEFMRGDPLRFHVLGFSEAQWTSLVLVGLLVWAEVTGSFPLYEYTIWVLCGMTVSMGGLAILRKKDKTDRYRLSHPNHVRDLAGALDVASVISFDDAGAFQDGQNARIKVAETSLGIRISTDIIRRGKEFVRLYAISNSTGDMDEKKASILSAIVLNLKGHSGESTLVKGSHGIYHLLVVQPRPQRPQFIPIQGLKHGAVQAEQGN